MDTREIIEKIMRTQRAPSSRNSDLTVDRLISSKRLINPKTFLRMPPAQNKTTFAKVLMYESLRLKALRRLHKLKPQIQLSKLDEKFFNPFQASTELEEIIDVIKQAKHAQKKSLSKRLRTEVTAALQHMAEKAKSERDKCLRSKAELPEIFRAPEYEIERAIITQLNSQVKEESDSGYLADLKIRDHVLRQAGQYRG